MQVTITLGKRAIELVTGIPESELPSILSDVVERSLESHVIQVGVTESDDKEKQSIDELKELLKQVLKSGVSINAEVEDKLKDPVITNSINKSSPLPLPDDSMDDVLGAFDYLLK